MYRYNILKQATDYWLPFIKTTRRPNEKPQVVLVGTHLDKCVDKRRGRIRPVTLINIFLDVHYFIIIIIIIIFCIYIILDVF